MKVINITDTKAQFSKLIAAAASGESFVISKAGKVLVTVTPIEPPDDKQKPI